MREEKENVESGATDILRRVEENRGGDSSLQQSPEEEEEDSCPLKKRRKLDSAEVENILNAKSSHDWEAREVNHVTVT